MLGTYAELILDWLAAVWDQFKALIDGCLGSGTLLAILCFVAFVSSFYIFVIKPVLGSGSSDNAKKETKK